MSNDETEQLEALESLKHDTGELARRYFFLWQVANEVKASAAFNRLDTTTRGRVSLVIEECTKGVGK